ncbi:putative Cysteine-rich receptor-like protein kinase 25 [Cocos nucifera]|nr:putative Cysteine-rich receptor-like protein kinase 25 [Cocos nucifera]
MASILSLFPLLIFHVLLLGPTKIYSQNDPILTYCAGDTNYTVPSTFSSNLELLLSNFTSSPRDGGYFSTATAGADSSAPAYGLAQCRPDASASDCSTCLNRSAAAAAARCLLRKSAAIRFDLCILRYSDQSFFGQLEEDPTEMLKNANNASDPTVFNRQMKDLMDEISSQAAGRESKFAVGITNYSDYGDIYEMAQCTRDLSETDCSTCLDQAVGLLPTCCYGSIGGQVVKVSCAVRFETDSFFSLSLVPPPPPGSSSSPNSGNGTDTTGDGPTKIYSQNDPILTYCAGDTNYTVPSTFSSNLELLLSNFTSSPRDGGYFSTATAGADSSAPAYGLAQCRPDASASDCSTCLNRSAAAAAARCLLRKSAAIRFDLCILRYSDQSFFGQLEEDPTEMLKNANNASDPTVFNRQMKDLMDEISSQAAGRESKFAVGITNYSDYGDIYEMAQCTRDLSETDCSTCLDQAVGLLPTCCYGSIGGQVVKVSCAVRFETDSFFSLSLVPPPPPGSSSSPNSGNGTDTTGDGKSKNATKVVLIVAICVAAVLVVLSAIFEIALSVVDGDEEEFRSSESLLFDLGALRAATNNFSDANKLGEGGFGPVYKGTLRDGREIAVKRLSGSSGQGLEELRNELVLVAKLQHRNLVKLFGCCIEEQERLLVYEYLPNTSLDKFLFVYLDEIDPVGRQQLDWGSRYKIIEGMGRGLLYLHEDSRLRIIHRDLKAGNILLDGDMNPKISDFGLAKLFGRDETHGNTSRIAGTYYGVLVLEIVTGRRNSGFQGSGNSLDLLGYVWQHWNEGIATQVIDRSLGNQYQARVVLRCIHIGLLCVQEEPAERPSMASVILMLSSYSVTAPPPSPPAFFLSSGTANESEVLERDARTSSSGGESSSGSTTRKSRRRTGKSKLVSLNDVSITDMEPR